MNRIRYTVGRWIMHAGLRVMPHGRGRRELDQILTAWGRHVIETVETARDAQ